VPSWKIVVSVGALGFLAACIMCGVIYARTPIPSAQAGVDDQGSTVFWSNKSAIMRLGEPRENVDFNKIPDNVKHAVLAAEDRDFYTEPGISPTGIGRALVKTATGGDVQGGSTITQQLARNYYQGLSQERSISRKFKEIFISIRMGKEKPKDEILGTYLNTIYFGRRANGVQAASRAFFGTDVQHLNVSQAALIAAMIQQPNTFHTQPVGGPNDPAYRGLVFRWNYVLDGMVTKGWLSSADRAKQQFPKTRKSWTSNIKGTSQAQYIQDRIQVELTRLGITDQEIGTQGYKIYTSLDQKLMDAAQRAIKTAGPSSLPKNVRIGLISVDPANGEIPAFYGGNGTTQSDAAFAEAPQVGSSFKPYVLATALKQGYNVKSMIDGHSPQAFDGSGNNVPINTPHVYKVSNDAGDGPMGVIDLVKATALSVNTAYVKLGLQLGLPDVMQTAEDMGVPKPALEAHKGEAGIALGIANYPAVYQAAGYATFANGGYTVTPHVITKITKVVGGKPVEVKLPWNKKPQRYLTQEQTAQATLAMRSVVTKGTGQRAAIPGRPVAGKTGTTEHSVAAWFTGYVPQLSTAVTMFNQKNKPITNIPGYAGGVYGGQIPASIWKSYMTQATQKFPVKDFVPPTWTEGDRHLWDTPKPSPTPTPTPNCQGPRRFQDPACQNQGPNPQPTQSCDIFGRCTSPSPSPTQTKTCNPAFPNCKNNTGQGDPGTGTTTQTRSLTPARTDE
jgi:membrane peptidoglycan carboxypeptidase